MSGYWAMGSARIAPTPASMMMMAITQAKIGRSMKIRENMAGQPPAPEGASICCGVSAGTG